MAFWFVQAESVELQTQLPDIPVVGAAALAALGESVDQVLAEMEYR
jgi:hypothetical protein